MCCSGLSYESQGLKDPADDQYAAALRLEKKYIPAHIARGNLAYAAGDLKKAEASYRRALRIDPNNEGANNNMAMVLLQRGKDLDKAERYAQTALKQNGTLRPYVLDTLDQIANARGNVAMKL
jgi:Tfp pilus assembly protein PilF